MAVAIMASLAVGCGKKEETSEEETPAETTPAAVYQPTGDEGTIIGKVTFEGEAPTRRKIDMSAEGSCASKHPNGALYEDTVVNDGALQNVFVRVKSGLGDKAFAAPSGQVNLDQTGCMYVPHVVGVMAGQELNVTNSDQANHNINVMPANNRAWNESQAPGASPIVKTFAREEVMIPVKCNQHTWMKAYIGVLKHPFYGVSNPDGTFEIKGLPPGDYEIEAWHEKLGAQTMQVTVAAKETKSVDIKYQAETSYGPGSLRLTPAMVLPMAGSCCAHGGSH
jgi:plastocyanin